MEMRYPSKSGLELAGKIVSVVYLENEDVNATSFTEGMADGFAHALEQDYGTGEGSVGVYRMRYQEGEDFTSKESLMNLIIDTVSDLVVLFDPVELGTLLSLISIAGLLISQWPCTALTEWIRQSRSIHF